MRFMYLTLLKHHWKYHRSITIAFIIFLSLFLILLNVQTFIAQRSFYLAYNDYFENNNIDWVGHGSTLQSNVTNADYTAEINSALNRSDISRYALVVTTDYFNANLSISQGDRSQNLTKEILIGTISTDEFNVLNYFGLMTGNISNSIGSISTTFEKQLKISSQNNTYVPINISAKNTFTNKTYEFSLLGNFTAYEYQVHIFDSESSFFIINYIDILLPPSEFFSLFSGENLNYDIFIQQNRQNLYSITNLNQDISNSKGFSYSFTEIKSTYLQITYYPTETFFSSATGVVQANQNLLLVGVSPSLIVCIIFGSLLTQIWNKEFFEVWLYFKPRGLKFTTIQRSYLLYASVLAIVASFISVIFTDIIINASFTLFLNRSNVPWLASINQNLPLDLGVSLIIAIITFFWGLRTLKNLNLKEVQQKQYEEKKGYSWAPKLFIIGIIGIIIPYSILTGIYYLPNSSVALTFWFSFIIIGLIILVPFSIILGFSGTVMRYFSSIEGKVVKLLPRLHIQPLHSIKVSKSTRIGFIFIVVMSLQLFIFTGIYDLNYTQQRVIDLQYGNADYASDYLYWDNVNLTGMEIFQQKIMQQVPNIIDSWITTKVEQLGYFQLEQAIIQIYRYNGSDIPIHYNIPESTRTLLIQASKEGKGILLNTGRILHQTNLNILFSSHRTLNISVYSQTIALPGFTPEMIATSQLTLMPIKPSIVQLFLPISVDITKFNLTEWTKIQIFTNNGASTSTETLINNIFSNQFGIYSNPPLIASSTTYNGMFPVLTDTIDVLLELILFSLYAIICFTIYSGTELIKRKEEFGPYLSKGLSFTTLRRMLLMEIIELIIYASISAWIIVFLLVLWAIQFRAFQYQVGFILPIIPLNVLLSFSGILCFYIVVEYFIFKYIIKPGPIIKYKPKVE